MHKCLLTAQPLRILCVSEYRQNCRAAAELIASGDCRFGIILCGPGQGIMMATNKVYGIRCGVCADTFSARMIRQHNDANMFSLGARVVGEGLALSITVTTFLITVIPTKVGTQRGILDGELLTLNA